MPWSDHFARRRRLASAALRTRTPEWVLSSNCSANVSTTSRTFSLVAASAPATGGCGSPPFFPFPFLPPAAFLSSLPFAGSPPCAFPPPSGAPSPFSGTECPGRGSRSPITTSKNEPRATSHSLISLSQYSGTFLSTWKNARTTLVTGTVTQGFEIRDTISFRALTAANCAWGASW